MMTIGHLERGVICAAKSRTGLSKQLAYYLLMVTREVYTATELCNLQGNIPKLRTLQKGKVNAIHNATRIVPRMTSYHHLKHMSITPSCLNLFRLRLSRFLRFSLSLLRCSSLFGFGFNLQFVQKVCCFIGLFILLHCLP